MNETFDDLERELQTLRPRGATPALRSRIAERLERRLTWPTGLVAAGIAAAVAAAIFTPRQVNAPQSTLTTPRVVSEQQTEIAQKRPSVADPRTLWDYRRMTIESGEDFDLLIETRHPAGRREPVTPTRAMLFAADLPWKEGPENE